MRSVFCRKLSLFLTSLAVVFISSTALAQQVGSSPDIAFDTTNDRYLKVWEEEPGDGSTQIMGKFLNPDGSDSGSEIFRLSPDRPTQGCFYANFDSDNGDISTPANCSRNLNPTVAYNNGQYFIAWEVHGTAGAPASAPDNQFTNIFARIVDANTLDPLPGWEEGVLVSRVYIASNNADACSNGKFACSDSEIQAWSQSQKPDVAARLQGGGFVVTWQTNRDYIGCVDPERRKGISIYGRYVDQSFSASSNTNPDMFAVFKDDSTMDEACATLSNVDNGSNPRIAYNVTNNDFVVIYEVARADGGRVSIGAKRVTLNSSNLGSVGGSMMPSIVATLDEASLTIPDIVSFKDEYVLFVSDGSNIRAKSFSSDSITSSSPNTLGLGSGNKLNPRGASNLGVGGQRPTGNSAPERLAVVYEQGGAILAAVLDDSFNVLDGPTNLSDGVADDNINVELSSDLEDFVVVWEGDASGEQQVFAALIDVMVSTTPTPTPDGQPPTAPQLLTPDNDATFAPTRAYLSWAASTDPDGGSVTYNVYFGEGSLPANPQITGLTGTEFVIGPETQSNTGITLEADGVYVWAIEAVDSDNNRTRSAERTLNTDDSVVGWWRFDENPAGSVCPGGGAGETVCDYSGNNNHGVPNGNPTWIMPGMTNVLGGLMEFDGVNDVVTIQNNSTLNLASSLTISCKIIPLAVTDNTAIISKAGPFSMTQTTMDELAFEIFTPTTYTVLGDISVTLDENIRVVGVYNGTSVALYFNKALQGSIPATGMISNSTNILNIGYSQFWNAYYQGAIDECIILNKALESSELNNLTDSD
jgi:hypothetical protein